MTNTDAIIVKEKEVSCDGGGGPLGHPKVFLNMGRADNIECPYCGKKFVLSGEGKSGGH